MTLRLKIVLHDIMNKINDSFARILSSEISAKKNVIAVKDYTIMQMVAYLQVTVEFNIFSIKQCTFCLKHLFSTIAVCKNGKRFLSTTMS